MPAPAATPTAPAQSENPSGTSRIERLDFLKQVVLFSEANVRSFDTKAQISLAALGLTGNPIITIINVTCPPGTAKPVLAVMLVGFLAAAMAYGFVLWPVSPPAELLRQTAGAQNLFFVADPAAAARDSYVDHIRTIDVEAELSAEALKLAYVRTTKSLRFRRALLGTVVAYGLVVLCYLFVSLR